MEEEHKDRFILKAPYKPTGDQPEAIAQLTDGLLKGDKCQTLLGVTGSGKTFTMANVIAQRQPPHAGAGAQQNAGCTALHRVQGVFSGQRGGVFRKLLRLLPAGGLHSVALIPILKRTAPSTRRSTACAIRPQRRLSRAARRHHRGQRLVHLFSGRPH